MIYTESECDLANDELNRIIGLKEDLVSLIDNMRYTFQYMPNSAAKQFASFDLMAAVMEENFDEIFYKGWHHNRQICGDVTWNTEIPSCDELRFKMIKDSAIRREARRLEKRLDTANKITALKIGLVRAHL